MLTDTTPDAAKLQRELWGKLPAARRLKNIAELTRFVRELTRRGLVRRHPEASVRELNTRFIERVYGDTFPAVDLSSLLNEIEIPTALVPVIRACEKLELPYRIGGSLASSLYGEPRSTNDVDLIIAFGEQDAEPFVRELGDDYLLYADSLAKAVKNETRINALHCETAFKIDVFPLKSRQYDRQAAARGVTVGVEHRGTAVDFVFASPEDMVIAKLEWFRKGNEVSEKQWTDILGLLRAETVFFDFDYIERWTRELGVFDLFERALDEIRDDDTPPE